MSKRSSGRPRQPRSEVEIPPANATVDEDRLGALGLEARSQGLTLDLQGIAAQWKSGHAGIRWQLLNALFERLHVKNRQIMGYTPRGDRAGRVALLIGTARDYLDDGGPGAARVSGISGKGGIPSVDWQYRVRIA